MNAKPYAVISGGVRLAVRLTPRAAHDRVDGIVMGADGRTMLQIRLTAPPVEGAANASLVAFLADALHLRKKDVVIRSGQTGRIKIVELAGEGAALLVKLAAISS